MADRRLKLDQHFLVDTVAADRIVAAAAVAPGETVIEIGPGRGVLTRRLLARGARVTAVELDGALAGDLVRLPPGPGTLKIVEADFLRLDLAALPAGAKFVANLPYAVAAPILQRILSSPDWTAAVLMFQKEVVERILAEAGTRKYGVLSVSVALKARAFEVCQVGRRSFDPPPKVDSAVVRLERLEGARFPDGPSEQRFFRVVRAAFAQRRKMAANSIAASLAIPRERVERALSAAGLAPTVRAEEIGLDSFLRVAGTLPEII